MEPKQKLRLLILAVWVPFVFPLLWVAISHYRPHAWLTGLWWGYGLPGFICVILYVIRHPELRPSPEEKARRLAKVNPRVARIWTSISLLACIAMALIILLQRNTLPNTWRQCVTPNQTSISIVHAVAWVGLVVGLAGFVRLCQVWYRNRKAPLANSNPDGANVFK